MDNVRMQAAHTALGAGRAPEQPIVSASEHRYKRFPVVQKQVIRDYIVAVMSDHIVGKLVGK